MLACLLCVAGEHRNTWNNLEQYKAASSHATLLFYMKGKEKWGLFLSK